MIRSLPCIFIGIFILLFLSCNRDVKTIAKVTAVDILRKDNSHLKKDYHAKVEGNRIVWSVDKALLERDVKISFRFEGDTMIPNPSTRFNLQKSIDITVVSDTNHIDKAVFQHYKFQYTSFPKIRKRREKRRKAVKIIPPQPLIIGYFPSWKEYTPTPNSALREVPAWVNHLFIAFAKPEMRYRKGSYSIGRTGLQFHYPSRMNGKLLKNTIKILHAKGIKVLLSIGGGTYCNRLNYHNIHWSEIKALVDDMGFDGIDWDIEPNGSFYSAGNSKNVKFYKDVIRKSRKVFPRRKYILACAPSGVGALGGRLHNDINSPFSYENRNHLTQESDFFLRKNTSKHEANNRISLYGFRSTGHMIPVFKSVGKLLDIVAYQGYNIGTANDRTILYNSYAYYGHRYGFKVAAGVHVPLEGWGPFYHYGRENVAHLASHMMRYRSKRPMDGVMVWHLLREESFRSNLKMSQIWRDLKWKITGGAATSGYEFLHIADLIFKGQTEREVVLNARYYHKDPFLSIKKLKQKKAVPHWDANRYYEKGEIVRFHGCKWEALNYTLGQYPQANKKSGWKLKK
ncbi:glycoside hydrolase family 18 protein [Halosquirtibacter xylanolyticus]|uniref:glycosyl hydrolase family 18 protein n=1 Tax=Halosquirtibacter xylanolyticus TaxID=3374599 RepID=UPI003749CC4C|nr:glycoside hydrolase family 18 protein [Prolixibacteraceae bacterium]